jgi:hypothetical protein
MRSHAVPSLAFRLPSSLLPPLDPNRPNEPSRRRPGHSLAESTVLVDINTDADARPPEAQIVVASAPLPQPSPPAALAARPLSPRDTTCCPCLPRVSCVVGRATRTDLRR